MDHGLVWVGHCVTEEQNIAAFPEGVDDIVLRPRGSGCRHHADKDKD